MPCKDPTESISIPVKPNSPVHLARQPASGGPMVQSLPAWGLLPPTPHGEKKASGGPAAQSWPAWGLGNYAVCLSSLFEAAGPR